MVIKKKVAAKKAKVEVKVKAKEEKKPAVKKVLKPVLKTVKPRLVKKVVKPKEAPVIVSPVAVKPVIVKAEPPKPVILKPVPVAPKPVASKPEITKPSPLPVKPAAIAPVSTEPVKPQVSENLKTIELDLPITVKDLSVKLQEKPSNLIKKLMGMGIMAGINQGLDEASAVKICQVFGFKVKKALKAEELMIQEHEEEDKSKLRPRSPVVTFMGHVDHGKTSLLDAIRKSKVAEQEHGGITQHIGAYEVALAKGKITFLDTPGHEAFTAMRSRGARITDIVVLVVAADDGIMPQTVEAIDHARAAGVPIIVAVNKIDKPQADIDKVKKQLSEVNLAAEDWGGKTITVGVSAKTGEGIDNLLEMIILEAEMLEVKANYERLAKGVVVEAKISKGRGPVATLLVQNGTLHVNDNIIVGQFYGKIRAMFNYRGRSVKEALPAMPVEVLGLSGVPEAGEQFFCVADEKIARDIALSRQADLRQKELTQTQRISLEELYSQIKEGKLKELNIILKSDVQGSLEAIKDAITKLNITEIKLNILHEGVGTINTSDAILAAASDAHILGFHVEADDLAKEIIAKEGLDVRTYNIIYELTNDLKAALEGMLEPKMKKVFMGKIELRKVFKLSRHGTIAGCFVLKGKVTRSASVALVRNGETVFEGKISSLKRFKDDVREVAEGFECGISLAGFDAIMEGDIIEAYEIQQIARKLQ